MIKEKDVEKKRHRSSRKESKKKRGNVGGRVYQNTFL